MKLGIFCNYSWPHIGGSEYVLKNISELLARDYGYEVNVYSCSIKSSFKENGVNYFPCARRPKGRVLFQAIQNDHIFIYSDSFWEFDTLVENIDIFKRRASVGLVGAYNLISNQSIANLLKKSIERFNLIVHSSSTFDYHWCINNNLPVTVIPNGINLSEFRDNNIDFREKYNIKEKHILLNVSNYFFGKGQELLPKIYKELEKQIDDFVILSLSNTIKYKYDNVFLDRCKKMSEGLNIKFFRDLPREDVVAAFKSADVFMLTSRKEVAPLVILESRAAQLPYVSLMVGNIGEQKGGGIPVFCSFDQKGYAIINKDVISHYAVAVSHLLKLNHLRKEVIKYGQIGINEVDWKNIIPLYDKVFRNGTS